MAQTQATPRCAALLSLPTEMLCKIASHVVAPELVVAAGRDLSARTALRKGTDAAERSRFGGIGLTVREAEQVLRTRYRDWLGDVDLDSRESVRRALHRDNIVYDHWNNDAYEHPDAPDPNRPVHNGWNYGWFAAQFVRTIIAYGADPSRPRTLHFVASHVPPDAIGLAKLILAAGVDIDTEGVPGDLCGTCALSWCVCNTGTFSEERCALATFLIEQGCDVVKADAGYGIVHECHALHGSSMLQKLEQRSPRTPAIERLMGLISAALEAAGPERRNRARLKVLGFRVASDGESSSDY